MGFFRVLFRVSLGLMMMMMMMMMMCKRFAQVPMLCVPMYNMKLAMMQTTPIFTTFSAHTRMTAEGRGQNEVFGRSFSLESGNVPTIHFWESMFERLAGLGYT